MLSRLSTRDVTLVALFAALTAAGALVAIPVVGPVPFTLQVLFVLLAGLVLGPRLGPLSMVVYLLVGLVAPVYAGGTSGLGALFGPTGGYLWGFVASALLVGLVSRRLTTRRAPALFATALLGLLPIYGLGAAWLSVNLHTTDFAVIVVGGVLQFLPLDIVKAVLAGLAARAAFNLPLDLAAPSKSR